MEEKKEATRPIGQIMYPKGVNQAMDGAKIPPQALELEGAVLGSLMLESRAMNEIIDMLKADAFYDQKHGMIFKAISELFTEGSPIDILTVTEQLKLNGDLSKVGGPYYVSTLTNKVGSTANVETHARIITQKYIMRELIRMSNETIKKAYDETEDVFDLLDYTENSLYTITEGNLKRSFDEMGSLMKMAIDRIEDLMAKDDQVSGVPSGFPALDKVTSGWQNSDMVIIAARPGMGKTAFVLSMARNMAVDHNRPVAIFSLEMSSLQLVNRLIASETEISSEKLRKGSLKEHEHVQLHARIKKLAKAPLYIDDTPAISIFELRAKCRRLKQRHNIEIIIIDYLQLMTAGKSNSGNREQEISTISRSIKSIAKELNVPILALSQLSRAVETRGGSKRPMLSDLRESGAIEQDADLVAFIYRPEYYQITEDENGMPTEGIGEIIIAKHRNGALEDVKLRFIGRLAKFTNLDTFQYEGGPMDNALQPNEDFDNAPSTITLSSKMNDDELDPLDNSPF